MGSTESIQSPFATHCVEFKNAREKVSMIIIRHRDSDVTNAGLFGISLDVFRSNIDPNDFVTFNSSFELAYATDHSPLEINSVRFAIRMLVYGTVEHFFLFLSDSVV